MPPSPLESNRRVFTRLSWTQRISDAFARVNRYRFSVEGTGFIAVMCLIGFVAWHSGTNLLYLMFANLIAVFLVHGGLVWLNLREVSAERILPRHASAREETVIPIRLTNRKRLFTAYGIRIVDSFQNGGTSGSCFIMRIAARSTVDTAYSLVFPRRGLYRLRKIEILTRYPFGLVERGSSFVSRQELLVYPEAMKIDQAAAILHADMGEQETRSKGSGTDLYGLREYVPGEHARHIHWRSSIKARRLMVMEYENEERRRVTLHLHNVIGNSKKSDSQIAASFEQAVVMTGSLARLFVEKEYEIELVTAAGHIEHGTGSAHLHRVLSMLAVIEMVNQGYTPTQPDSSTSIISIQFPGCDIRTAWPGASVLNVEQWKIESGRFVRSIR